MPTPYVPLAPEPITSASDSEPATTRSIPLRPPPFEIPDPFAPFKRGRLSIDSEDSSSSQSDYGGEEGKSYDGLNEKGGLMRAAEDPEDNNGWRERKQAQAKVRSPLRIR